MAVNSQDFGIIVGVEGGGSISGTSGRLIQSQLNTIFQNLNTSQFKITLSKNAIDATTAVRNMQSQIQAQMQSIKINPVVVSGTATAATSGSATSAKSTATSSKMTAELQAQIKLVKTLEKSVTQVYSAFSKAGTNQLETSQIDEVNSRYAKWQKTITSLSSSKDEMSAESISDLQHEAQEVINLINQYKELQKAQASAAKKADGQAASAPVDGSLPFTGDVAAEIKKYSDLLNSLNNTKANIQAGGFVADDDKSLVAADAQINKLSDSLEDLRRQQNESKVITQGQIDALQQLGSAAQKAANDLSKTARTNEQAAKKQTASLREVQTLYRQIDSYLNRNPRALSTPEGQDLSRLRSTLLGVLQASEGAANGLSTLSRVRFTGIRSQAAEAQTALRSLGMEGRSVGNIIADAYQKFGGWTLITRSLTGLIHQFREMVNVVKDIDSAMTELRKVTDETDITYANFLDGAAVRAQNLGATISDTVSATADFARLGYDIDLSSEMADAALVYKNVGDGIEDIGTASESIISTMQAFRDEAHSAMSIVDRFNEVDNKFAITALGVGEALTRSASAMAAANNTLDESIALITAANTVVQNPEHVGTTLKTVSMYLRAAKTEAEEAGESTDGMAASVSELRESLLALTGGKVDIQIDEDTFKSTYQIMDELSQIWDTLTDISQANILEMIGGKRNSNVVAAVLENFDIAREALEVSANSSGSALAENEKQLESIEGHLTRLRIAFEELSMATIDSESFKTIIDGLTTILNLITEIIDTVGTLPTLAATFAGLFTAVRGIKNQNTGIFSTAGTKSGGGALIASLLGVGDFKGQRAKLSEVINASALGIADLVNRFNSLDAAIDKTGSAYKAFREEAAQTSTIFARYADSIVPGEATIGGYINFDKTNDIPSLIDKFNELSDSTKRTGVVYDAFMNEVAMSRPTVADYFKQIDNGSASMQGLEKYCTDTGKGLAQVEKGAKAASIGMRALDIAMNTLVSLGITLVIQGVVSALDALINAEERAFDRLKETTTNNREAAAASAEELSSLDDLISKYEGVASAETLDSSGREEIRSIQEEIVSLVGSEATGLNLVNGRLEEQLSKLREIRRERLEQALEDARVAYTGSTALTDSANGEESTGLFGLNKGNEYVGAGSQEIYNALVEAGYAQNIRQGAGYDPNLDDMIIDVQGEGAREIYEQISGMLDALKAAGLDDQEIYTNLAGQLKVFQQYIDDERNDALSVLDAVSDLELSPINEPVLENIGDLAELREDAMSNIQQDSDVAEALSRGSITTEDIEAQVDSLLQEKYPALFERLEEYNARVAANEALDEALTSNYINVERKFIEALSDEDLAIANSLLITDDTIRSWDDLITRVEEYKEAQQSWGGISDRISTDLEQLYYSDDFEDTKAELEELAQSADGISADKILELADSSDALNSVLNETGMTAEYLAHILETMGEEGGGLDLITPEALELNSALEGLAARFDEVTEAQERYNAAASVEEKDEDFRSYAEAFEALNAEFEAGTVNSNAFWAAAEFLFGKEQLDTWGWTDGVDQIYQAMQNASGVFENADSAGAGFLDKLYEISNAGQVLDSDGNLLATIQKLGDGSYSFDIDGTSIAELAKQLGITEEATLSCVKALDMWGRVDFYDTEEVLSVISDAEYAFGNLEDGLVINASVFEKALRDLGKNGADIHAIFESLSAIDGVTFLNIDDEISTLIGQLANLDLATTSGEYTNVDYMGLANLMQQLQFTRDEAEELFSSLSDIDNVRLTNAEGQAVALNDALEDIGSIDFTVGDSTSAGAVESANEEVEELNNQDLSGIQNQFALLGDNIGGVTSKLSGLISMIEKANKKDLTIDVNTNVNDGDGGNASPILNPPSFINPTEYIRDYFDREASGTTNAPGGPTLTGEEGEELVLSGDEAYFVGTHGPEFVNLSPGDTVYTAKQTKQIKRGLKGYRGIYPARASGQNNSAAPTFEGGASGVINTGPFTGAVDVEVNPTIDEDALEKLHEEIQEYLNDRQNAITIIENAFEFDIEENDVPRMEGHANEMILHYREMQQAVIQQAKKYLEMGATLTTDQVTEMIDSWKEYEDAIKDIKMQVVEQLQQMVEEASSAVDEIQNVYDVLQNAADEYAQTNGYISVDAFQEIVSLGAQYMQYLTDENGLLVINEENIKKVIAAKTEQLALENAMAYIEQLRLALADDDITKLNELLYATTAATDATWGLVYASLGLLNLNDQQYAAALHNIDALRALAENAMAGIFQPSADELQDMNDDLVDELEAMKDGASSIIEYVMDMLEDRVEEQIDKLEELKDTYADIIELKKESLETTREENEYNDEIADKVQEIADLQTRIDLLALDDSRSAQAERNQLLEEMNSLQEELADQQADHALEQQTESLDDMQEAYEQEKDNEIAKLEETISSTEKLYRMAIQYIRDNWKTLLDELLQWNYDQGTVINQEIVEAWNNALAAAKRYGDYISQDLIDKIQADIDAVQGSSSGGGHNIVVGPSGDYDHSYTNVNAISAIVNRMKSLSAEWSNANGNSANNAELHRQAESWAAQLPQYGVTARYDPSGTWYIQDDKINPSNNGKELYAVYHSGGIAGEAGTLKNNEILAKLQKGEAIIPEDKTGALYKMIDFVSKLKNKLDVFGTGFQCTPLAEVMDAVNQNSYRSINTTNNSPSIQFGDVNIYGQGNEAIERYKAVNRSFVNEVLDILNIRR